MLQVSLRTAKSDRSLSLPPPARPFFVSMSNPTGRAAVVVARGPRLRMLHSLFVSAETRPKVTPPERMGCGFGAATLGDWPSRRRYEVVKKDTEVAMYKRVLVW